MTSMGVREQFHGTPDLINVMTELTSLAGPSTHNDMFWEKHHLE